jgi:ATP-dependent helicase/nuclease subunit A
VRLSDVALKLLAPQLTASIAAPELPMTAALLDAYDRRRLQLARADVPRWLTMVDELPPAELLDRVLAESAYAAELEPRSYRQARENLKKVRGLVRRIQNRGYATLNRIVEHLGQLAAGGDESNAMIDAADAVNLMTIHAAKGLEFPIVFVVNLHRSSGGSGDPIRIVAHGSSDDDGASVVIGDYESEADRDLEANDTEEAKRLLYVALTRARDRLHLAATLNPDGRFAAAKGSIGRVMPPILAELLTRAGAADAPATLEWTGPSATHRLQVLKATGDGQEYAATAETQSRVDAFEPLAASEAPIRIAAASRSGGDAPPVSSPPPPTRADDADADAAAAGVRARGNETEAGILVHRALAAGVTTGARDNVARRRRFAGLLRAHERAVVVNLDALLDRALAAFDDLGRTPLPPHRWYEVPFSLRRADGSIVRGAIDLIAEHPDGRIEVIEFKTGRPKPEHDEQLAVYLEAARALFPEAHVEGRLVYAGGQLSDDPGV